MVDISRETDEEIEARLVRVIRSATLTVYPEPYLFVEFPLADFDRLAEPTALALVRDDQVWSQLVPSLAGLGELFTVFRFHFPPQADNSGFVGWLASRLKRQFGTGVFVTCGQNSRQGGIFDYWGVPIAIGEDVVSAVRQLCQGSN